MSKIIKVRLTEFYPFTPGLSEKQKKLEGGVLDRLGKPLNPLEDYIEGKAPYVSLSCDKLGGPPGNVEEFRTYGYNVWIPEISAKINSYIDNAIIVPIMVEFRLVDTGENFFGKGKVIREAGHEPIDVCRRIIPAKGKSFSGMSTELWLKGKP